MEVTVLSDMKQIGKTKDGTKHPISGRITNHTFNNEMEFAAVLYQLKQNECLTIGLFPDQYNYVPAVDMVSLTQPHHITRTKQEAKPGHLLLIDCDYEQFHSLKGEGLHDFLSQYLPDIFDGAAYVTTYSTSYYTKGKEAFHQYYLFKHRTDFSQLNTLIDKLFQHHNILTYSLASNYSRTYIKTPIDTKLHELQMPVFEFTEARAKLLGLDITKDDIHIDIHKGHIIDASMLSLPSVEIGNSVGNSTRVFREGEADREVKLIDYLKMAKSSDIHRDVRLLEEQQLPADLQIVASLPGSKEGLEPTTVAEEIVMLLQTEKAPHELYQAIGEPSYANHQTAKLLYSNPYTLGEYMMVDQAHGGTKYQIIYDFNSLDKILSLAKNLQPVKLLGLLTAKNCLTAQEAQLLGQLHNRKGIITPANMTKALMTNDVDIIDENLEFDMDPLDVTTGIASMLKARMKFTPQVSAMIAKGVDTEKLFMAENIQTIRDSVYSVNKDDVMLKPGPKHGFNIASRSKIVKQLAPLYPTTNISEDADEYVLDALIQKYTATNKVTEISYKTSMHGEKLYFGDGRVEITYQQQRPTFNNVPTSIKHTLDNMSQSALSEFKDIYMNQSLGCIWSTVSELSYIKKIHPQLKKDFLHLHLKSNVGKSFNMDIANIITPYEKTNLDQFFEQAAKINPINIAKSAFLFHDEVKNFHHQWNELGAFYSIKQAYAADSIQTQLPLKVLASAEDVMKKGTKQQYNRLMVMSPDLVPYDELGIATKYESLMMAVTYQVIYEEFINSYNKYAMVPEQKALQMAITAGNGYGATLSSKDMQITGDYIQDTVRSYLVQELVDMGSITVAPSEAMTDAKMSKFIKVSVVKGNTLHVSFKKQTFSKLVEFILIETTSSLEARSMNYEALAMTWEDIGCYKLDKPATKGGRSGFYGYCIDIKLEEQ